MSAAEDGFQAAFGVSRETMARLRIYESLLHKWNPAINLVSRNSLDDLWHRHFADSAQTFRLRGDRAVRWADLGSGGGFPGMVIAIMATEAAPDLRVTLVESDMRKAAFLTTVARETGTLATVVAERIEAVAPLAADIVSARALAPLDALLAYAEPHIGSQGKALFLKGSSAQAELDMAVRNWRFTSQAHPSLTDPAAVIIEIKGLSRV